MTSQEHEPTNPFGITPGTPVTMSLRTQIAFLVGIGTLLATLGSAYFALASTDKDMAAKLDRQIERITENKNAGESAIKRSDLKVLRLQIRADLLGSEWHCRSDGRRMTVCTPTLPPMTEEK